MCHVDKTQLRQIFIASDFSNIIITIISRTDLQQNKIKFMIRIVTYQYVVDKHDIYWINKVKYITLVRNFI